MQLKELGRICREFRKEQGISVKEIASKCSYTPWNIYKFEQGNIDSASILLVYMFFGLELDRRTICHVLTN
jgi:transcriptional regulator with XRE-family HTH domain